MPVKPRKTMKKRVKDQNDNFEKWKVDYILEGIFPDPKEVGFELFVLARDIPSPTAETGSEFWERVKDKKFVKDWKALHGETFWEKQMKERARHEIEIAKL
jgi:hypothetical protein